MTLRASSASEHPLIAPRRPLATRHAAWARSLARWLANAYVMPNSISLASVVFAAGGCAAFAVVPDIDATPRVVAFVLAALAIQLRLLCNLLDGMIAVEEGFKTKSGDIFNDVPDRVADVLLLAGAGYGLRDIANGPELGWLAAVLALFTAYVRVLGGSLGVAQSFTGPMAKQHRMFALTIASLGAAVESSWRGSRNAMWLGLLIIVIGSMLTAARRIQSIVAEIDAR
jgi:phosphatidylglycerophosphate synthase